jgi:K+-transporting ATPase c subunit
MQRDFTAAAIHFLLLTMITGVVYPGVVTGVAQIAFHEQANGSLIVRDGKPIGSALIGQPFSDPKYFSSCSTVSPPWCRRREFTATAASVCLCERLLTGKFHGDHQRPELAGQRLPSCSPQCPQS